MRGELGEVVKILGDDKLEGGDGSSLWDKETLGKVKNEGPEGLD